MCGQMPGVLLFSRAEFRTVVALVDFPRRLGNGDFGVGGHQVALVPVERPRLVTTDLTGKPTEHQYKVYEPHITTLTRVLSIIFEKF